jgi:hypothetical protein
MRRISTICTPIAKQTRGIAIYPSRIGVLRSLATTTPNASATSSTPFVDDDYHPPNNFPMTTPQKAFFSQPHFAIVGASKDQTKFGTKVSGPVALPLPG